MIGMIKTEHQELGSTSESKKKFNTDRSCAKQIKDGSLEKQKMDSTDGNTRQGRCRARWSKRFY